MVPPGNNFSCNAISLMFVRFKVSFSKIHFFLFPICRGGICVSFILFLASEKYFVQLKISYIVFFYAIICFSGIFHSIYFLIVVRSLFPGTFLSFRYYHFLVYCVCMKYFLLFFDTPKSDYFFPVFFSVFLLSFVPKNYSSSCLSSCPYLFF